LGIEIWLEAREGKRLTLPLAKIRKKSTIQKMKRKCNKEKLKNALITQWWLNFSAEFDNRPRAMKALIYQITDIN
jgi:hypothetical protein